MSNTKYSFSYTTESYRDAEVFVVRLYENKQAGTVSTFLSEARCHWTLYNRPDIDITKLETKAIGQAISELVDLNSGMKSRIDTLEELRLERINR